MLEETILRFASSRAFAPPMIVCGTDQRAIVVEQLGRAGCTPAKIVLEPTGRGTAPAAALAALLYVEVEPDSLLLALPADHFIGDLAAFLAAIEIGAPAAQVGRLVTFGIKPDRPETGYGYIRASGPIPASVGCFAVDSFVEKPDLRTAEQFVDSGDYLWNAGIFLFRADRLLAELETHEPTVTAACRAALNRMASDDMVLELDQTAFATCPTISIDHAVMERTDNGAVVPADMGWSDIGSWKSLWQLRPRDAHGNVRTGSTLAFDTCNSYLSSEGPLIATIGLDGYVVVASKDAVLVCPMERVQEVNELVNRLRNHREGAGE